MLVGTERIVADRKELCLSKLVELVKFSGSFLIVIGYGVSADFERGIPQNSSDRSKNGEKLLLDNGLFRNRVGGRSLGFEQIG